MTVISATSARKNLYRLIDQVSESHQPIHISGKRHAGVLVSEDDWRAISETLFLLSIPGMRDSIMTGMKTPVKKCRKEPGW